MANILDYLDWRGDLTFDKAPFNEVDNLLLSQLVYVDLAGIVPGPESKEKIRVAEASRIFFATHDEQKIMEKISELFAKAFPERTYLLGQKHILWICSILHVV